MTPVVLVEHLTKSFDGRIVLDDVHLRVESGTIVSIIGQSGGGKTTLLRCVNLLERPDQAEMSVAGRPSSPAGTWSVATWPGCAGRWAWSSSGSTCSPT